MTIEEQIENFVDNCGSPYKYKHTVEGIALVKSYAKQQSIEFFKWREENSLDELSKKQQPFKDVVRILTTEECYDLFIQSQSNK